MPKSTLEFSLANAATRFDFTGFEIPASLEALGSDNISVLHQFPGGRRVFQSFGVVPQKEITWHGLIFGPNSFTRAQQLQAMVGPLQTTLTYGPYSFTGLVKSVKPTPGFEGYVPYHVVFEPDAETSNRAVQSAQATDQVSAVSQGISAGQQAATAALAGTTDQVALNLAAGFNTALSNVTYGNYAASVGVMTTNANLMFTYVSSATDMTAAGLVISMYVQAAILAAALGSLTSPNYVTVTVDSPNLFLLAGRYYNNSSQWVRISTQNGGIPPFNTGLMTLVIPLT